jgi:soluble lytic murein transglycosylase
LRYQTNGNYDQAIAVYLRLLEGALTPDQVYQARYHLAESYSLTRDFVAAAAAWEKFVAGYPDDPRTPRATLMLARAYHAANEWAKAIRLYDAYLEHETVLADLVYEWLGDCYAAGEQWQEAIASYRQALGFAEDPGAQGGLWEKIAGVHLATENYDAALAEYDAILDVARTGSYRAKIEYLAGRALAAGGQIEAAHARYHRALENYPKAEYAYLSLGELINDGVAVDEFQRGLVDHFAGASYPDAHEAAVTAFDRYLTSRPAEKADEALYRKAISQRALDRANDALETLEALISGYPRSKWLSQAWMEKGAILADLGDNDSAVRVYQDVTALFPADDLAVQALWQAAKLREGEGNYREASRLYEAVQAGFPAHDHADEALWRGGLAHYREGAPEKAIATWKWLLGEYSGSPYEAKSLYWLGKLGAQPENPAERSYWEQLTSEKPHNYYALKVLQLAAGESLTVTRLITVPVAAPTWDAAEYERAMLAWLGEWTSVPSRTRLITLPVALSRRADFRRGEALLDVGLRSDALEVFESVRRSVRKEPLALAQLAPYFREQGLHGLATRCASRLAALWPRGTIHDAPLELQRLGYPLVYADLLSAEAQARGLDPLLLAALVRQESLFEPAAESYAGARGLGQVMPGTGKGIARNLGVDDFVLDDLYRPSVGIQFGAFYLGRQLKRFGGQILVALAAYNGGPGNALRWSEAAPADLDLFVEVITASQSRLYLQHVYEHYLMYEALYRSSAVAGE